MSRYVAGWLAIVGLMALLLYGVAAAAAFVGPENFGTFVMVSLLLGLPVMVGLAIFPRCPRCRTSVFVSHRSRWLIAMGPWSPAVPRLRHAAGRATP